MARQLPRCTSTPLQSEGLLQSEFFWLSFTCGLDVGSLPCPPHIWTWNLLLAGLLQRAEQRLSNIMSALHQCCVSGGLCRV